MPYISVNPEIEPDNRLILASQIHAKRIDDLTPQDLAEAYNLIEGMGCELPPPGASVVIFAEEFDDG